MALPTRRTPARALTASAARLTREQSSYSKRLSQPWQLRSLGYYDSIGEINFTAKYLARQFSRVRFYPGRLLADQTIEPVDGLPLDLLDQVQDPGGGRTQLQFDYARLDFITGEGVLFGYAGGTKWKYLWKDELRREERSGEYVRLDSQQQPTDETGVGYRFWTPHPRHSDVADAPMRAVQDICEELLVLTLSVRSTAYSRMTNGIFKMPQEVSPNPLVVGLDEDPQQNPFLADWIEHVTAAIEDPGSAAALVPFLMELPNDYLPNTGWERTHDPATDYMERELRTEAIKRLALSLDMSPEDLLGYTDSNHWTARAVQLDRWRMFGYPKAQQLANGLADAYLRPALELAGYDDPASIVVTFDDSQVVISPDRTEDALKAYAQGIINGQAARTALGWGEQDKLDGEEKDEFLAIKLREPALLDGEGLMLPARGPMPAPSTKGNPLDGPPAPGTKSGVSRRESLSASVRIEGAASLALQRCRELAGIRLRHKCSECGGDADNSLVASVMGSKAVADPVKLVSGGADGFHSLMREWGLSDSLAGSLKQTLEVYAARTLFQSALPDLPQGFIAQVHKAQEVSDALADSGS